MYLSISYKHIFPCVYVLFTIALTYYQIWYLTFFLIILIFQEMDITIAMS